MPELPEVETVRKQLVKYIVGKTVMSVTVLKDKSWSGETKKVAGQQIKAIERRSKILRFILSNDINILAHLKMSGQLIYIAENIRVGGGHPSPDWVRELPSSHTRVFFTFADGTKLFFNDQRIFGWMRAMTQSAAEKELAVLAPDITDPRITAEYLFEKYQKRSLPIKVLVMDNTVAAGVGNIYACDGLNLAKISPVRSAKTLSKNEVGQLLKSLREVIELGIQLGGATIDGKYIDVKGLAGRYQTAVRVYGREGLPCPNCGSPIQKTKVAGRGTYYCPVCQK